MDRDPAAITKSASAQVPGLFPLSSTPNLAQGDAPPACIDHRRA
jgi:hypothetical protein